MLRRHLATTCASPESKGVSVNAVLKLQTLVETDWETFDQLDGLDVDIDNIRDGLTSYCSAATLGHCHFCGDVPGSIPPVNTDFR